MPGGIFLITIAFSSEKQAVKELITTLFLRENIFFSSKNDPERNGFALLTTEKGKFDIALNDNSSKNIIADFVTIIDSDNTSLSFTQNKSIIISYGLNSLATVVASSINTSRDFLSFQFCLQRSIATLKGALLEPQEFPVTIKLPSISISDALAYCVLALICGISKEKISLA